MCSKDLDCSHWIINRQQEKLNFWYVCCCYIRLIEHEDSVKEHNIVSLRMHCSQWIDPYQCAKWNGRKIIYPTGSIALKHHLHCLQHKMDHRNWIGWPFIICRNHKPIFLNEKETRNLCIYPTKTVFIRL